MEKHPCTLNELLLIWLSLVKNLASGETIDSVLHSYPYIEQLVGEVLWNRPHDVNSPCSGLNAARTGSVLASEVTFLTVC